MTDPGPQGSPVAIDELLEHAEWLRALARRLVGSADLAADLEQETWLAALEHPPRHAAAPRHWLGQVMRNLWRQRRRSEHARRERERSVARPEADPASADATALSIERARALQSLLQAVLALDEPYRSTLLLRFQDGLSAEEIARRQGVSSSTVRNRVARGLADLRARLERRDGEAWSAVLVPLLLPSTAAATAGVGASTGAVPWIPAMTASKWLAVPVLALLGAIGLWLSRVEVVGGASDLAPAEPATTLAAEPAGEPASTSTESTRTAPVAEVARSSEAAEGPRPKSAARGSVEVSVRWASDGSPAAGIGLHAIAFGESAPFGFAADRRTDEHGRARFDDLAAGSTAISPDRADGAQVVVRPDETTSLELVIPAGILVRGTVRDTRGDPVAGARIWLSDYGNSGRGGECATADAGGRFELRDVGEWRHIAARADGYQPSQACPVRGKPGEARTVDFTLRSGGVELRGVVRDTHGRTVAGATVIVGVELPGRSPGGEDTAAPAVRLASDADGRFAVRGLAPGRTMLQCRSRGLAPWGRGVEVAPEGITEVVIELAPGATVEGVVRGVDGAPAARIGVAVGRYGSFESSYVRTQADGVYRLEGLLPGRVSIRFRGEAQGDADLEVPIAAGEVLHRDVQLAKGALIAGQVLDEHGTPLGNWSVGVVKDGEPGMHRRFTRTDAGGAFTLDNLPPLADTIEVHDPEARSRPAALVIHGLEAGKTDYRLVVGTATAARSKLVGRVAGPDGRTPQDLLLFWHTPDSSYSFPAQVDSETGRFEVEVTPGVYEIAAQTPEFGMLRAEARTVRAGETADFGLLAFTAPGRVHVKLVGSPELLAAVSPRNTYVVLDEPGRMGDGVIALDARLEGTSRALAPGEYTLRVNGDGFLARDTATEVRAGETSEVRLSLEPATSRVFEVAWGSSNVPADPFRFMLEDATGAVVQRFELPADPEGATLVGLGGLLVGAYTASVETKDGRRGMATFRVDSIAPRDPATAARDRIRIDVR